MSTLVGLLQTRGTSNGPPRLVQLWESTGLFMFIQGYEGFKECSNCPELIGAKISKRVRIHGTTKALPTDFQT